jgi:hypothetical protein
MSKKRSKRVAKRTKPTRSRTSKMSPRAAVAVATNARKPVKERLAAMGTTIQEICADDDKLQAMLNLLRDTTEPTAVRLAAMQALQAASFSVVKFESCRPDYLAALRAVATDPDAEIRQRALGHLAREKDGFAQQRLLAGLQEPEKALVSPEKALQLLSYDIHAEAYSAARKIVSNPPNPAARREALRLLAADAASRPVFEQILRNKKEAPDVRQLSASALQALAPESLQTHARAILLDNSEPDALRTTSLTALTQFGDEADVSKDEKLMKGISSLRRGGASSTLKRGAQRFMAKYGR